MFDRKLSRRQFLIAQTATALTLATGMKACTQVSATIRLAQLETVGEDFTFALVADPQLKEASTSNPIFKTAQQKLTETIQELNQLNPPLPFVIFNGDMVHSAVDSHVQNFLDRVQTLKPLPILVHGNHDGNAPYTEFKRMQRQCNGTEDYQFSFNCGRWHFVTFPCNLGEDPAEGVKLLHWLAQDLKANQHKPTMIFEHYHLLPQGLTTLAWYSYDKQFRQQLIDVMAKYGNVRYVICGHVHNGIQTSIKTAWTYKDINFITAPTCTAARNFGEEYPQFHAGQTLGEKHTGGGFYLLIDIKGETAKIRGRLVGTQAEVVYPEQLTPYLEDKDPLWFKNITDYEPSPTVVNPTFENGLQGWLKPYRYTTDTDPGFVAASVTQSATGKPLAHLRCHEKGQIWAGDELIELYQFIRMPTGGSPVLKLNYAPEDNLKEGGGYAWLCGYSGNKPKLVLLLHWGDGHNQEAASISKHLSYGLRGQRGGMGMILSRLIRKKQLLFWQLPAVNWWHQVELDLESFYNTAVQKAGAFNQMRLDRVLLATGVWCSSNPGARSGVFLDRFSLDAVATPQAPLIIDGNAIALDQSVFHTDLPDFKL